jgi:ABC-type multidrug transport system ATPase subunit/pSer/pThr/pTyr-binding forkhead associated (FHA) protein
MERGSELPISSLKFLTGPLAGNIYPITKAAISLGRGTSNDIVIFDPSVSRHHAQIMWENGIWTIKKLASDNSLTVNQYDLPQSHLSNWDTIGLGSGTTFIFLMAGSALLQQNASSSTNLVPAMPSSEVASSQIAKTLYIPQILQDETYPRINRHSIPTTPPSTNFVPADFQQTGLTEYIPSIGQDGEFGSQINCPWLEVSINTDQDKRVYPFVPYCQVFDIGRDASNTIVINHSTVSSFHAQIVREGNQLVLIHPHPSCTGTHNGLTYHGMTVRGNEQFRHTLSRGDIFRISNEDGTLITLTYNDGSGMTQEVLPEIRPIPLGSPVITIGRAADNTVVLNHPTVSGHHARLEQVPGGYRIIDMNSTNHVYVNSRRIQVYDLKPGDEIHIGPFRFTHSAGTQLTQHDESSNIRIDALHLKRTGNNKTVLLNDISLTIPPRKFVALVGGSGTGKSTLMNALNGMRPAQSGAVFYNGQDYYQHFAAFSTQLGYVPQDDIIHRDLSVERALYYAAKLRLPKDFTAQQIRQRIDEVLDDVEMKHRRHLLISKLSGGQRKRVSIALELLAKPSVFFLDEPTSGLDPGLDRKMMLLLRKLADKGHTIVLVTHATNNINVCDYICFLCQGGRLAYYGPPGDAKAYFGKSDFAEIYNTLEPTEENPHVPEQAEARFRQSVDYVRYILEPLNQLSSGQMHINAQMSRIRQARRGNPWKQFILLSMRYLELILNDKLNLAILVLQAPIIGLILYFLTLHAVFRTTSIATCYAHQPITANSGPLIPIDCQTEVNQLKVAHISNADQILNASVMAGHGGGNAEKILFIMAFAAIMFGCLNGAREIVKEAAIYQRERTVNLGIAPYLCSKICILGIFSLIQSFILVFSVNLKDPLSQVHSILFTPFVEIYITMALTALSGLMTGLLVSAIVPNNDQAMSLVPLPLIPQVIFAGVLFSLDNPPFLQELGAFFAARWSMAAMGSTIGLHGDALGADNFSFVGMLFTHIDGNVGHQAAGAHLLICWEVLGYMIVLQGILIAWLMKRKDVRR